MLIHKAWALIPFISLMPYAYYTSPCVWNIYIYIYIFRCKMYVLTANHRHPDPSPASPAQLTPSGPHTPTIITRLTSPPMIPWFDAWYYDVIMYVDNGVTILCLVWSDVTMYLENTVDTTTRACSRTLGCSLLLISPHVSDRPRLNVSARPDRAMITDADWGTVLSHTTHYKYNSCSIVMYHMRKNNCLTIYKLLCTRNMYLLIVNHPVDSNIQNF